MSSLVCSHCGCSDIDLDTGRGDAVCTQCGSVLEDQIIVNEVQFAENSMGGASVVGQYVSAEGPKSMGLAGAFHHGVGKESRQITLDNGKQRIQRLGAQLKLNQHCIETAFNFFKMAVIRRLTRGRKTNHVIAACVYIVCRTEGTSHMLIDFSDVLQIDVYTLGHTYLQLSKALCITIPAIDPCLYIQRFAHKLEFEDKTHEVSMTALKLVQRMKRDWMAQGRRPSGLCGAALLVAARIHDFNRKIKDIIRVVKIGEGTVRKRLAEFEATPSSQLTIDQFTKIDLEEEMDPPCFTEGKKKAKLLQLEESGQLEGLTQEILELREDIDRAIEQANQKRFRCYKKLTQESDASSEASLSRLSSPAQTPVHMTEYESPVPTVGSAVQIKEFDSFLTKETLKDVVPDSDLENINSKLIEIVASKEIVQLEDEQSSECGSVQNSFSSSNIKIEDSVKREDSKSGLLQRPSIESLGITNSLEEYMKDTKEQVETVEEAEQEGQELDLTGIDDEELDKLILTEEEVTVKTKMWLALNADYLKEQREKQERREREEEEAAKNPDAKKKKRPRKKQVKVEHQTAADAIKKILQEKKISSKINYDVLKDLNKVPDSSENTSQTTGQQDATSILGNGPIEVTPIIRSPAISSRFKRLAEVKVESEPKKPKLEPRQIKQESEKVTPKTEAVIVESGPVVYDAHEDEAEEDFEEEEEEEHISAAALMGHGVEDEYGEYGYDDDD